MLRSALLAVLLAPCVAAVAADPPAPPPGVGGTLYILDGDKETGKMVFPKVYPGDTVQFRHSCQRNGGDIKVKVEGPIKLSRETPCETVVGGKILPTGTLNMVFQVDALKPGTGKVVVTVKAGTESKTIEYDVTVDEPK